MNLSRRQFLGLLPAIPGAAIAVVKISKRETGSKHDLPTIYPGDPNYLWLADVFGYFHPVPPPKLPTWQFYDAVGNIVNVGPWVYTG